MQASGKLATQSILNYTSRLNQHLNSHGPDLHKDATSIVSNVTSHGCRTQIMTQDTGQRV